MASYLSVPHPERKGSTVPTAPRYEKTIASLYRSPKPHRQLLTIELSSPPLLPAANFLSPSSQYTFTTFPAEIRNEIYSLCFPTGYIATIGMTRDFSPYFSRPGASRRCLGLLLTSKAIYVEARRVMYSNTVFFLVNSNHKVKGFLTETDPDALSHIRVLEIVHGQGWPLVLEDEKRREQRRMGPKSLVWKPGQVDLLTFGGKYKGYDVVVKLVGEKLTGLEVLLLNLHILDLDSSYDDENFPNWPEISLRTIFSTIQDRTYPHFRVWGKPLVDLAHRIIADEMKAVQSSEAAMHTVASHNFTPSKPRRVIFPRLKTIGAVLIPMFMGRDGNAPPQPLWIQVYPDHDIEYLGKSLLVPEELSDTAMEGLSWIAMIGKDAEVW